MRGWRASRREGWKESKHLGPQTIVTVGAAHNIVSEAPPACAGCGIVLRPRRREHPVARSARSIVAAWKAPLTSENSPDSSVLKMAALYERSDKNPRLGGRYQLQDLQIPASAGRARRRR
jgi:hypothetical protein